MTEDNTTQEATKKQKSAVVNFPCAPVWFKVPHLFQDVVYAAHRAYSTKRNIEEDVKVILMEAVRDRKFMSIDPKECFEITFDEAVREKIAISLSRIPYEGSKFVFEIDFEKDKKEGVTFLMEGNRIPINVFSVEFEDD